MTHSVSTTGWPVSGLLVCGVLAVSMAQACLACSDSESQLPEAPCKVAEERRVAKASISFGRDRDSKASTAVASVVEEGKTLRIRGSLEQVVDRLGSFPHLQFLSIYAHDPLRIDDYRQIARLERVEDLFIETYATISGSELRPLADMPRLRTLEFKEADVNEEVLKAVAKIESLKVLRVPFAGDDWKAVARKLGSDVRIYHTHNYAP